MTIRFTKQFSALPERTRNHIMRELGKRGGKMRTVAQMSDCPVTVAYNVIGGAIGWACCIPRGQWSPYRRSLMVYVLPAWRRKGVATKLLNKLFERLNLYDKALTIEDTETKEAARFFQAFGFTTDNLRK